jgi:hypothetical protein
VLDFAACSCQRCGIPQQPMNILAAAPWIVVRGYDWSTCWCHHYVVD